MKHLSYNAAVRTLLVGASLFAIVLTTNQVAWAQEGVGGDLSNPGQGSTVGGGISGTGSTVGGQKGGTFFLQNPLDPKFNTVGGLISGFVEILAYLFIILAVLMIIYVGFRFVLARGDVAEIKKRKDQLLWLVIGVALIIGARVIITVVINTIQATGTVSPGVIDSAQNALHP